MASFRPKYITFDCYGTLTNFQMAEAARDLYGSRLDEPRMQELIKNPALAKELGEKARLRAMERFHIQRFIKDWNAALQYITGQSIPCALATA